MEKRARIENASGEEGQGQGAAAAADSFFGFVPIGDHALNGTLKDLVQCHDAGGRMNNHSSKSKSDDGEWKIFRTHLWLVKGIKKFDESTVS
jgi:hypothetical protein